MRSATVQSDNLAKNVVRPILKWAGGKSQLLDELFPKTPKRFGRYIEPFFGGGAFFFALNPKDAVLADRNAELVNLYRVVASDVDGLIEALRRFQNSERLFYKIRSQDWDSRDPIAAAARTIFLNRTCFNGLYRVNRKGQFNVPFGRYTNPKILDEDGLRNAARLLGGAKIVCGNYLETLRQHARPDDFVFLDPPYLPISKYSDFKRFTKEQFYEDDHRALASEVRRLQDIGCHIILTNSNHPLVHDLYRDFKIEVIQTKRYISCNGRGRFGEDVIVEIPPRRKIELRLVPAQPNPQTQKYPTTRFMGSKRKLLAEIWAVASQFQFETAIDLFSGSGIVSYMFKAQGKAVISNDHMAMSAAFAKAMVENNGTTLSPTEACELFNKPKTTDRFVERTFKGLYYTDEDNRLIDVLRQNINSISDSYKRSVALSALIRASLKKRPRGIFTYVGHRYDDGRKDLTLSFREHFLSAVETINAAVFDNGKKHQARHGDALSLAPVDGSLVYIDPPYYSRFSDNAYVRRYHFVEGLARNWTGVEIQQHTVTKKFKSYSTPFSSRTGASKAFDALFRRFRGSTIIVSYSSNCEPDLDEMVSLIAAHKKRVEVVPVDYRYSFGTHGHKVGNNKNAVQEYLFVGF